MYQNQQVSPINSETAHFLPHPPLVTSPVATLVIKPYSSPHLTISRPSSLASTPHTID